MTLAKEIPPFVSIIVPCRNEEALIAACLDSIVANDYPVDRLEILTVDGMSRDRTRAIVMNYAEQYPHLRVVDNVAGTIPAAMNCGIRASRGEIILKIDAHSTYPPDYIRQCVGYLCRYEADMTGGICTIAPRGPSWTARSIALALSHRFGSGTAYIKTGVSKPCWADAAAFGCWRKSTLLELRLFDERMIRNSDMDLNLRLRANGGKILLAPDIRITYYADGDLRSFWSHNFSDGIWVTYPIRFGKRACSWRHVIPAVFLSSILVLLLFWPYLPIAAPILLFVILAYAGASMAATMQICSRKREWRYAPFLSAAFLVRHVAHGLGALYGFVLMAFPARTWTGHGASGTSQYRGKRVFDVLGALTGLVLLSPVFALLGLAVKVSSAGPVLYKAERVGKEGMRFNMLKFRTMYHNGGDPGTPITLSRDPRVTKLGAWLRRLKLDELPQLINVWRGEMSLVGPRPEAPLYFQYYSDDERERILSVLPGMTDYGSLRFHHESQLLAGEPDPVKAYVERIRAEKVQEQIRYIREQSLWVDIKIIVRTIIKIVSTRLSRKEWASDGTPREPSVSSRVPST